MNLLQHERIEIDLIFGEISHLDVIGRFAREAFADWGGRVTSGAPFLVLELITFDVRNSAHLFVLSVENREVAIDREHEWIGAAAAQQTHLSVDLTADDKDFIHTSQVHAQVRGAIAGGGGFESSRAERFALVEFVAARDGLVQPLGRLVELDLEVLVFDFVNADLFSEGGHGDRFDFF